MDENVKSFLEELSELSKKYKMYIGGCGCCGSPFVDDGKKDLIKRLTWNDEKEKYEEY